MFFVFIIWVQIIEREGKAKKRNIVRKSFECGDNLHQLNRDRTKLGERLFYRNICQKCKILKSLVSEKIEFEVEVIGTLSTGHSEPVCSDIHCECTCIRIKFFKLDFLENEASNETTLFFIFFFRFFFYKHFLLFCVFHKLI